jgi:hypothetical protein
LEFMYVCLSVRFFLLEAVGGAAPRNPDESHPCRVAGLESSRAALPTRLVLRTGLAGCWGFGVWDLGFGIWGLWCGVRDDG